MTTALASRSKRTATTVRSDHPLSDDQIARVAPSIYAESAHESRSERYAYIATKVILDRLRAEGFQPFMASQSRVRNEDRREFTKHVLRLRHPSDIDPRESNEIVLVNSHDGSSRFQLIAGMYRLVCQNGLVAGQSIGDVRIAHKGDVALEVVQAAHTILERFRLVDQARDTMRSVELPPGEALAFARAALQLRYDSSLRPAPITEDQILMPRRPEDVGNDLWSTFNRVQENLIRGGLQGRSATGRYTRTREIQGIDQNVMLNRALWTLAEGVPTFAA